MLLLLLPNLRLSATASHISYRLQFVCLLVVFTLPVKFVCGHELSLNCWSSCTECCKHNSIDRGPTTEFYDCNTGAGMSQTRLAYALKLQPTHVGTPAYSKHCPGLEGLHHIGVCMMGRHKCWALRMPAAAKPLACFNRNNDATTFSRVSAPRRCIRNQAHQETLS